MNYLWTDHKPKFIPYILMEWILIRYSTYSIGLMLLNHDTKG